MIWMARHQFCSFFFFGLIVEHFAALEKSRENNSLRQREVENLIATKLLLDNFVVI